MSALPLIKGLLTFVPGMMSLLPAKGPGHTDSGVYCYSVWLKHLTLLRANGMTSVPATVAELGPGESLGVGLAALLSGADHYVGLDVSAHSNRAVNHRILDELVALFSARAGRPEKGWPDFDPYLDASLFPSDVLTPELLERTLHPSRLKKIRAAIDGQQGPQDEITIAYRAPWSDPAVIAPATVDLVLSHSVLEHVVGLPETYAALHAWLKPGGWMSHQIDFKSHGLSREWNGYRAYSELRWKMMMGRRVYMINQAPRSTHLDLLRASGFDIVLVLENHRQDGIPRSALAPRFAHLPDADCTCSGLYVIARK